MKRKLDVNNVPTEADAEEAPPTVRSFEDLKLDPRLLQALIQQKFTKPTLVQAEAIPLALAGKDVLGAFISCHFILDCSPKYRS
jgi:ATP-dependent RNA helicase DDX56/DBP9